MESLADGTKSWVAGIIQYSGCITDWIIKHVKRMDIATQKAMKVNGVFHPKPNFERLFLKSCEGGRPCHEILVALWSPYTSGALTHAMTSWNFFYHLLFLLKAMPSQKLTCIF